jgi:developmental checkpoint coupling sporulation initiation to replication initiation
LKTGVWITISTLYTLSLLCVWRIYTCYSHRIHNMLCITGAVVLLFVPCYYDKEITKGWKKGCVVMELLSDEMLVDTYSAAMHFELEPEFIRMLAIELKRRRLNPEAEKITA